MKTIEEISELLAATETGDEATALMKALAKEHGYEFDSSEDILITDPNVYACDDSGSEVEFPEGTEPEDAAKKYVSDGDWGDAQGSISVHVYRKGLDECGDDACTTGEWIDVDLMVDVEQMIKDAAAGAEVCGYDDDDHDWTSEGEGGLSENPGVWSHGGTTMSFQSHCRCCGLHKTEINRGSQRNPGEAETEVSYKMLDAEEIERHIANGDMDERED